MGRNRLELVVEESDQCGPAHALQPDGSLAASSAVQKNRLMKFLTPRIKHRQRERPKSFMKRFGE
jgi:hypothetical protein